MSTHPTLTDHQPLDTDGIPTASASEATIALVAPAALANLTRMGALDLAPMPLGDVAC